MRITMSTFRCLVFSNIPLDHTKAMASHARKNPVKGRAWKCFMSRSLVQLTDFHISVYFLLEFSSIYSTAFKI